MIYSGKLELLSTNMIKGSTKQFKKCLSTFLKKSVSLTFAILRLILLPIMEGKMKFFSTKH